MIFIPNILKALYALGKLFEYLKYISTQLLEISNYTNRCLIWGGGGEYSYNYILINDTYFTISGMHICVPLLILFQFNQFIKKKVTMTLDHEGIINIRVYCSLSTK